MTKLIGTIFVIAVAITIGTVSTKHSKRMEEIRSLPTITKRVSTMGVVTIEIMQPKPGKWCVVKVHHDGVQSDEFPTLMCAAEYLSYIVATKSNLGFEKALDLVREGAMTWRHKDETLNAEEQADG